MPPPIVPHYHILGHLEYHVRIPFARSRTIIELSVSAIFVSPLFFLLLTEDLWPPNLIMVSKENILLWSRIIFSLRI